MLRVALLKFLSDSKRLKKPQWKSLSAKESSVSFPDPFFFSATFVFFEFAFRNRLLLVCHLWKPEEFTVP